MIVIDWVYQYQNGVIPTSGGDVGNSLVDGEPPSQSGGNTVPPVVVPWTPWVAPFMYGSGSGPVNDPAQDESTVPTDPWSPSALEIEAVDFATAHVHVDGADISDPNVVRDYNVAINILARAYMFAKLGLSVNGPGSDDLNSVKFMQLLENTHFHFTNIARGPTGADNYNYGSYSDIYKCGDKRKSFAELCVDIWLHDDRSRLFNFA